jgi:2-iminobutanoate/2-iminopropanoate deaminase
MPDRPALFHMIAGAPEPVAPYCHAVEVDGWVLLTGQIATYPDNPQAAVPEGIEAQSRLVMDNLCLVLAGLGLNLRHVVRAGVYLTRFDDDYGIFNRIYQSYFEPGALPARTCIGVTTLARGARLEVDCIVRRP